MFQVSYTFPLHITCKKGGRGVRIACKNACAINGAPLSRIPHTCGLCFVMDLNFFNQLSPYSTGNWVCVGCPTPTKLT